jgi:hypothetical protein
MDTAALVANSSRFCPAWHLVDGSDDEALGLALGRHVLDGCPEPLPDELRPRWFAVTVIVGVAADDDGYPDSGEDTDVVRVGRGTGVVLATDKRIAGALTEGEFIGDESADGPRSLVFSFDLDDVTSVEPETKNLLLRGPSTRAVTVEVDASSWGAVGFAVHGELGRSVGQRDAPLHKGDADALVAMLRGSRL